MNREEMLQIASNMKDILIEKEVTPNEAEAIAAIFLKEVQRSNEKEKKKYMTEGKFK